MLSRCLYLKSNSECQSIKQNLEIYIPITITIGSTEHSICMTNVYMKWKFYAGIIQYFSKGTTNIPINCNKQTTDYRVQCQNISIIQLQIHGHTDANIEIKLFNHFNQHHN